MLYFYMHNNFKQYLIKLTFHPCRFRSNLEAILKRRIFLLQQTEGKLKKHGLYDTYAGTKQLPQGIFSTFDVMTQDNNQM